MAISAQTMLTAAETAYYAVLSALSSGSDTVEYEIRGRRTRTAPSTELLETLRKEVSFWKTQVSRSTSGPFRLAKLGRAR